MVLINESFDSLPYIDAEPSPSDRSAAESLIAAELASEIGQPSTIHALHPLLPPSSDFTSPLLLSLLAGIEASPNPEKPIKLAAIDLSRYEAVDAPSPQASLEDISTAIERSAVSSIYLSRRQTNLEKLNESGKEEWLAGNEGVSSVLEGLEKELATTKEAIDIVAHERQVTQTNVQGEMEGYERAWRGGVEGVLRTEMAAEGLRAEILERRRLGN